MFENLLADRMSRLGSESAFRILSEAQSLESMGKSIIHMELGQPDFPTPENIVEAGCRAIRDGFTGYGPTNGYSDVRETIAQYASVQKNIRTNADEVVIVPGGKPVMFFTMLMLIQPGDEVIYPNPGFPIYESVIRFAGGKAVPMPLLAKNDFCIDFDLLESSISERTNCL